jgi:3-dehydroquinate synthase
LPSPPDTIHVDLKDRSYDILLGDGLIADAAGLIESWLAKSFGTHRPKKFAVITDRNVLAHAQTVAESVKSAGYEAELIAVPSGESSKSQSQTAELYDFLVQIHADRRTPVIAVGGGVVGDLAGFAAATFNRGLPFIQVPTTLLSDVDSSVGGKVGINHAKAKNLIGAFHQPLGVLIDIACLRSLPRREYCSGLAEVVKYGVILDAPFFHWLETNAAKLIEQDPPAVRHAIARSCRLKADVVEKDEFERTGLRAVLNYGHTFAHAFEALAGYGELLHGEAVSIGMICASRLAERMKRIPAEATKRQIDLLARCQLPTEIPDSLLKRGPELIDCMRLDKKTVGGQLRFVLPTKIGHVELVNGVSEADVLAVLQ